ncbi:MAG: hypothetical protein WC515_06120 [Candidatus Omnitrophota bacterium]
MGPNKERRAGSLHQIFFALIMVSSAAYAENATNETKVINTFSDEYKAGASAANPSENISSTNSTKFKYISGFKEDYSKKNSSDTAKDAVPAAAVNVSQQVIPGPQADPAEEFRTRYKVLRSDKKDI